MKIIVFILVAPHHGGTGKWSTFSRQRRFDAGGNPSCRFLMQGFPPRKTPPNKKTTRQRLALLGFPEGLAKSAFLGYAQVKHLFKTAAFLFGGNPVLSFFIRGEPPNKTTPNKTTPNKKTTRQRDKTAHQDNPQIWVLPTLTKLETHKFCSFAD